MFNKEFIADVNDEIYYIFGDSKYKVVASAIVNEISINRFGTFYKTGNAKIVAIKTSNKSIKAALKIGMDVAGWSFNENDFNKKWFKSKKKLKAVFMGGE